MKSTYVTILVLILVGVFVTSAQAKDLDFFASAELTYWMPDFDGDVKISGTGISGTKVDLVSDLGMDDSESIPGASVTLDFLGRWTVGAFMAEHDGQKVLTQPINYKNATYLAGATVNSSIEVTALEAYYEWMLLKETLIFDQTHFELGLILGGKYLMIDTELKSGATTQSESIDGPVPIVGLQGEASFMGAAVGASVKGFSMEIDDTKFTLIDATAGLSYDFNRYLRTTVGYRYYTVDAEDEQDSAEIAYKGPYVGITGSF